LLLAAASFLWLLVACARVAFRLAGPVTVEALVDRVGAERAEFLRKSLRAPTALWFSLTLSNGMVLLLWVVVLFSGAPSLGPVELRPTGSVLHDATLWLCLAALAAVVEIVLPIALARADKGWVLERMLPVVRAVHVAFAPLSRRLERWTDTDSPQDPAEEAGSEEVQAYITVGTREGLIEEGEGELLRNVLLFGSTKVHEVMTPRTDVVGAEATATVAELIELMAATRFSRIPVHEGSLDEIVGVVALKDAVEALQAGRGAQPASSLMTPPLVVPESKLVSELLRDMQAQRHPLAIVADEYGGMAGLVTMEDLVEELVGEIREEHEEGEDIVSAPDGTWLVRGRASLHDVSTVVGVELPAEGPSTVGGFLLAACDRVPAAGEAIEQDGLRFTVEEADRRRVHLVRITRRQPVEPGQGAEREAS
jgi:magnesium and cobalt transporter